MEQGNLVYGLVGGLTIALLIAAFTDLTRRRIYNWLNLGIALCAPLFWWASGLDLSSIAMQLVLAVSVFALLSAFFALGLMGGGDVKLLTALALWLPWQPFLKLIVMMALMMVLNTVIGWAEAHWLRWRSSEIPSATMPSTAKGVFAGSPPVAKGL